MRSPRRVRSPRRAHLASCVSTTVLLVLGATAGAVPSPAALSVAPAYRTASPTVSSATVSAAASRAQQTQDVRLTRDFYVNQTSQAWLAGQGDPRFADLGQTPQALWMGDTWVPLDEVQGMARDYVDKANAANQTPLVAIYAIPARDCGNYSAGGFDARDYKTWIARMAKGLRGGHAMAVLEPDALGLLGDCAGQGDRTGLLRWATKKLTQAGVWVYLDAAHNAWVEPGEMARRLQSAGVAQARGFATNVASFVSSAVDEDYAREVRTALKQRGVTGVHWVTDTSRNGAGKVDGNDWCNPLDARVGAKPVAVGGGFLDAYIWAKSPGESDGPCNGGPAAGQWWPDYALRLTGQR